MLPRLPIGCHGSSSSGTEVYSPLVNNCVGKSSSGTAIYATLGIGCRATGTIDILYKYNMP